MVLMLYFYVCFYYDCSCANNKPLDILGVYIKTKMLFIMVPLQNLDQYYHEDLRH